LKVVAAAPVALLLRGCGASKPQERTFTFVHAQHRFGSRPGDVDAAALTWAGAIDAVGRL
jgi:hypothetical protein